MPRTKHDGCNSKWRVKKGSGCLGEAQCLAANTASELRSGVLFGQGRVFYTPVMDRVLLRRNHLFQVVFK